MVFGSFLAISSSRKHRAHDRSKTGPAEEPKSPKIGSFVLYRTRCADQRPAAPQTGFASVVQINVQRAINTIETSNIVIVPSVLLQPEGWKKGRYLRLVDWLHMMYDRGAVLCSACSGIFLLAETGLFDGKDATVHFSYARAFEATYPAVPIHPQRVL